jgi:hypothetical protein
LFTADLNGDGKADLISANYSTSGIEVLLGNGNGTFQPPASYATTQNPFSVVIGDFNGGGFPDLIVEDTKGNVSLLLNKGNGTFGTAKQLPFTVLGLLAAGDFNHDGKLDVADSTNQLALGNGDGTFQAPVNIVSNPPYYGWAWIAAGDINNDGWTDLVLIPADYLSYFTVLLNNQQGGFTESTITNGAGPQGIALADLNHDGNLDAVLWICCGSSVAYVYLGDGKGGFVLQTEYPAYPGLDTIMLAIGDVNGDGIPDLLLPADGSLGIAYGKGDGTFKPTVAWRVGGSPGQILLENLHGQPASANLPDIVSPDSSGGVVVLLNTTKK